MQKKSNWNILNTQRKFIHKKELNFLKEHFKMVRMEFLGQSFLMLCN